MRSWRLPLRIARRDALRHRGRSLLVLVMIALPVLAVTAADVLIQTSNVSGVESIDRRMGSAEAVVTTSLGSGKVVQTQELGKQAAGVVNFVWDGKSDAETALPAGNYTFAVDAGNGSDSVKTTALAAGMVSALTLTTDGVSLQLANNKSVAYSDILQIMN